MARILLYAAFIIVLALITFFGIGPVLLADGTPEERAYTFWIVVILYLIVIAAFYLINKRVKK
jgi:hypothetical protein